MSASPDQALRRAVARLEALQDPRGWWKGELETNVTMDAEDLLVRQFLGIRTEAQTAASARWIRSRQRPDGTWSTFYEGPPDLSTSAEAYLALRLAGDPPDAAHMRQAAAFVQDHGGVESARVFTRIWLALFGLWPWERLPVLPPELMFLPPWFPLNIYDFGCWARQTVVPLTVVGSYRPVRPLPVRVPELCTGAVPRASRSLLEWPGRFQLLDDLLQRYQRRPIRTLRRLALEQAEAWIVARQEADGSWGGIQPPWVYSLMALHLRGYDLEHPVMRAGLAGLDAFTIEDAEGRRLEACQSPVWDTALALTALADAGVPASRPCVAAGARWLVDQEITVEGDWKVRRPHLAPGGWAFEFANDHYPDVDDTAEVAMALARSEAEDGGAVRRGVDWVLGMQCADGGWGAFDADNTRALCRELPFCDFGELIDPPSADVTAHAVETLAFFARAPQAMGRGVSWLLGAQEADGSWFGRWGANHLYGTGAVVPALVAAGVPASSPAIRRAVAWLERCQNPDGGWGEDLRSYADGSWRGRGASTASQTAWALLALLAAGERGEATRRGVGWLTATQGPDGSWEEPWFTGTGFPGDFYINYHLYRLVFPVMALGRYGALGTAEPKPLATDATEERSAQGLSPAPRHLEEGSAPQQAAPRVTGRPSVSPCGLTVVTLDARLGAGLGGPLVVVEPGGSGARRAATELADLPAGAPVALVAAGGEASGGALAVIEEVRRTGSGGLERRHRLPGAALVAAELRQRGLAARATVAVSADTGPVGHRRLEGGSLEVPLRRELALLVECLAEHPLALVVTPGPAAGPQGAPAPEAAALRGLRHVLEDWAEVRGPRKVLLASPRSFCAGVERAIEIVERALARYGPPVYVRRQIVHNAHVVDDLAAKGAVFVEELEEIPAGSVAVLAAHGVTPTVRAEAEGRDNLQVIDATCPLVAKVHNEARRFDAQGRRIVLIGHAGHEEVEGTLGEAPGAMVLVETARDVEALPFARHEPIGYLTQTTLAVEETAEIVEALKARYPQIVGPSTEDICYATQNRQDAARAIAGACDLVLVIGSDNSSNTRRLVEVARQQGCRAELVEDHGALRLGWLAGASTVGVTAGASAPESLVHQVVSALGDLGDIEVLEDPTTTESVHFALPRQVR